MSCFRCFQRSLANSSIRTIELNTASLIKPKDEIRIVVIGAGIAGLSAAHHLVSNGFKSTVILEGTDRPGGRIKSKQFGDAYCELGAKWVSVDATQDTVYDLIRRVSGLQKKMSLNNEKNYMEPNGKPVDRGLPERVDELYRNLCSRIELEQKYLTGELHDLNSIHTYFKAETNKMLKTFFTDEEQCIAKSIFRSLFREFSGCLGSCLEYVNIEHITKIRNLHESCIYIPSGLDNVIHYITKRVHADNVRMSKPVSEITWLTPTPVGRYRAAVRCADGTVYPADYIICTLPLGVLKAFGNHMFKPQLPRAKLNAIKNLGFGNPIKLFFEYKKAVRPWFTAGVRPIWNEDDETKNLLWTKQVVEINKLPTSARVLEVRIGGGYYDEIERLSEDEIVLEVTKLLRLYMRNTKIPYPLSVLRSNWSTLGCYLGGRPFYSTESSANDVVAMASPLVTDSSCLLFAGDATIVKGFGNIDGARISGIREAQRIIKHHSKPHGGSAQN